MHGKADGQTNRKQCAFDDPLHGSSSTRDGDASECSGCHVTGP
jgi:hypothetical protein